MAIETNKHESTDKSFERKVWTTVGIITLAVVLIWILKVTFNVLLLVLAGALIALYFRGLSQLIIRKTGLSQKLTLPISIIGTLVLLLLFFWFTGTKIQQQVSELSQTLPTTIDNLKQYLNKSPIGQQILEKAGSEGNMKKVSGVAQTFFRSTFGVLGDLYVILFIGIFFTASPKTYTNGFLKLFPAKAKGKAVDVLNKIGTTLTKWLKGTLFAMLVVTLLTLIGLLIIGMPMAFALALIAGILNFIPNFGPLIAMIPAVLVGLMVSPTTALLVAGLYILVQVLESNIITPQIQKRLINLPPALIIIAQLFMGVLTGGWGLVLAMPLVAILIVVLSETYIKKQESN
jgi:predicted PurR-regulated permease PerM